MLLVPISKRCVTITSNIAGEFEIPVYGANFPDEVAKDLLKKYGHLIMEYKEVKKVTKVTGKKQDETINVV